MASEPFLATNAAARTELCYSRAAAASDERYSYRAELCYISLASPALSLQATSTHISSLHEHVAARKILGSLKNWSGHGLSNRTGSAGPAWVPGRLGLLLAAPRLCIYFWTHFRLISGRQCICACALLHSPCT